MENIVTSHNKVRNVVSIGEDGRILNESSIVEDNALILAYADLSTDAQKLFCSIIAKIDSTGDSFIYTFRFNTNDYLKSVGLSENKRRYEKLEAAIRRLQDTCIYIPKYIVDEKGIKYQHGWQRWTIATYAEFDKNYFEIQLNDHFAPYLLNLKRDFSILLLSDILALNSYASIRLYSLIVSRWKMQTYKASKKIRYGNHPIIIPLKTIREMLFPVDDKGKATKAYPKFGNLNQRILAPAIEEINKATPYRIVIEPNRKGNAVDSITFRTLLRESYYDSSLPLDGTQQRQLSDFRNMIFHLDDFDTENRRRKNQYYEKITLNPIAIPENIWDEYQKIVSVETFYDTRIYYFYELSKIRGLSLSEVREFRETIELNRPFRKDKKRKAWLWENKIARIKRMSYEEAEDYWYGIKVDKYFRRTEEAKMLMAEAKKQMEYIRDRYGLDDKTMRVDREAELSTDELLKILTNRRAGNETINTDTLPF